LDDERRIDMGQKKHYVVKLTLCQPLIGGVPLEGGEFYLVRSTLDGRRAPGDHAEVYDTHQEAFEEATAFCELLERNIYATAEVEDLS
jgi:hypothetical protein